jgi:hypothetical protein
VFVKGCHQCLLEAAIVFVKGCHQCLLKAAIIVGPVPPFLNFTDQVWAGAVLGCFVRALRWVQGTFFLSWGTCGV